MTLRLILVRHAKSSWEDSTLDDHDRALNRRGRHAAAGIATWLVSRGDVPGEVVSSTAQRTVETWERMAPAFADNIPMRREPTLYQASADTLLSVLRNCAAAPTLMLAHNPGIADFAARLLAQSPDHVRFGTYPSGATLVADFEITNWAELQYGSGRAIDFVVPSDLES